MNPPQQHQIQIELPPEIAEGTYANIAIVAHSPSEIVIDFARMTPGTPKAKVVSRVIMTPLNAKKLLGVLEKNMKGYEEKFGIIEESMQNKEIGFQVERNEKP